MVKRIYNILGGMQSYDGLLTSAGMKQLNGMLEDVGTVTTHLWHTYSDIYLNILDHQKDKIVIIGYSGGGAHATWIANGYREVWRDGGIRTMRTTKPRIDLMILYDPSPQSGMMDLKGTNVKRCICYHNESPMMLGIGGGKATGPMVEVVPIRIQHLLVQYSQELHNRTVEEIKKL